MSFIKAKWKTPAIIVGLIGLTISFWANMIQIGQNVIANRRADKGEIRVSQETERLKGLQSKKENWLDNLKKEKSKIDEKIDIISEKIRLSNIGSQLQDATERSNAIDSLQVQTEQLQELVGQRTLLQKEINVFIRAWQ